MEFCKKCGKPLHIEGDIAKCNCGFIKSAKSLISKEKTLQKKEIGKGVFNKKDSLEGFPHLCKKCGHGFADVKDLGVFYSDESSIYLFKCKKCGNAERDAYGTSNA